MKVKEIMTHAVTAIDPEGSVVDAAKMMQKHNVGSIPVVDHTGVIGIVTDRDIVVRCVAGGMDLQNARVKEVMTADLTTVTPETDMNQVTEIMAGRQIRRLPVVEQGRLVGILSLGDLAATQAKYQTEVSDTLTEISTPARPENMHE